MVQMPQAFLPIGTGRFDSLQTFQKRHGFAHVVRRIEVRGIRQYCDVLTALLDCFVPKRFRLAIVRWLQNSVDPAEGSSGNFLVRALRAAAIFTMAASLCAQQRPAKPAPGGPPVVEEEEPVKLVKGGAPVVEEEIPVRPAKSGAPT